MPIFLTFCSHTVPRELGLSDSWARRAELLALISQILCLGLFGGWGGEDRGAQGLLPIGLTGVYEVEGIKSGLGCMKGEYLSASPQLNFDFILDVKFYFTSGP